MTEAATIWALTDGRAGNEVQALGLAEAIGRLRPARIETRRIALKGWAARVPPGLSYALGARRKGWPFSGLAEGQADLHWPWPDLVIGAGRRAAPIVAAIRKLHGTAAVQILDPRIPTSAFDAVVVPDHDALTGGNVLHASGALSRLTRAGIEAAASEWAGRIAHLIEPRLAVLIGGPSKSARFEPGDERTLVLALRTLAARHGLMISTSRRTPETLQEKLRQEFSDTALLWTGEGGNPYPAILGLADAVLVTEDSVNMASEAASTGLPVHVMRITGVAAKISRFHDSLSARGASRRFTGEIGHWTYEPLNATDQIASDLIRRGII